MHVVEVKQMFPAFMVQWFRRTTKLALVLMLVPTTVNNKSSLEIKGSVRYCMLKSVMVVLVDNGAELNIL